MSTTLDDVIETVLRAREDGPEALAAMALSYGATMALGAIGNRALKARLAETRAAATAADEMLATLRHERDAALAECKAARQSVDEAKADAARLRALVESAADTAEVWRLRESVAALRADRARAVAERDRAVQEREAFSLRLSAAERERDEARAVRDLARESAREARDEIAGALALVDEARARVEAIAVERNAIISELSQTTDAMMQARAERDAAIARSTYEARTVAPTEEERRAHIDADGAWLVVDGDTGFLLIGAITQGAGTGSTWLPIGPDGLPCAWPVPSAEVSP